MNYLTGIDTSDMADRLSADPAPWGVWQIHRMADGRVQVRPGSIDPAWTAGERAALDSRDQETKTRVKPIVSFGPWWFVMEVAHRVAKIHAALPVDRRVSQMGWQPVGTLDERQETR